MSLSGEIDKYKFVHFATHGLVINNNPELSSLILSRPNFSDDNEDGFLTVKEISNMNFNVDFVNLSSCKTGLGKISSFEGVVGLTQAFNLAGAQSISSSLWEVSDRSTATFMSHLYTEINNGKTISIAMQNTKKAFINGVYGDIYKSPYYWAPFVYYGN